MYYRILLDFGFKADDEHDQYLVNSTSIIKCTAFIDTWEKNRARIRKSFEDLRTQENSLVSAIFEHLLSKCHNIPLIFIKLGKSPEDTGKVLQQDDTTFLNDLVAVTKSHPAAGKINQWVYLMCVSHGYTHDDVRPSLITAIESGLDGILSQLDAAIKLDTFNDVSRFDQRVNVLNPSH